MKAQLKRLFLIICFGLVCWLRCSPVTHVTAARRGPTKGPVTGSLTSPNTNQQTEDARQEAEELLTLAETQNYTNHILGAQTAQQALQRWQVLGDKSGMARAYSLIGQCYLAQSSLAEATTNYQNALALWRELNDPKEEAGALIDLGYVEARGANWQNSTLLFSQAESLINEHDAPDLMGQIAGGLAYVFNESGNPEQGVIQYQRALDYYRVTPSTHDDDGIVRALGSTYYLLGDYPQSLDYLQRALAAFDPGSPNAAYCHEYIGRVLTATHEYGEALGHLQTALNIYSPAGNSMEAARVVALIGQIYQQEGQAGRALQYYQRSLQTFIKLSDRVNQSAVLYALGRLELEQDHLPAAEDYLRQSIDVTESIRSAPTSRDLTVAFSATVHDRYENYIDCLMRKHRSNPAQSLDVRAFETSELARARSLADSLRTNQSDLIAGRDPDLAERERSLRQSLSAKEDYRIKLLGSANDKEALAALNSEIDRLASDYKQVIEIIQKRYPSYEQVTKPSGLTLHQIQAQVLTDNQTLLLEYTLGKERSYLWAVTKTQISSYELPGRAEIESEAHRFYDLLTAGQPNPGKTFDQRQEMLRKAETQMPQVTANLSKLLLAPVADQLENKRLIIVPDGALQYIPFQALSLSFRQSGDKNSSIASSQDERPLLIDHEIINEPSASILALVSEQSANRRAAKGSVAVVANPVFQADDLRVKSSGSSPSTIEARLEQEAVISAFRDVGQSVDKGRIPPLPESLSEAKAIRAVIPPGTGFEALDFAANKETVVGSTLEQFRIVHFATHALVNDRRPESSGIVLSLVDQNGRPREGFLRLNDIYGLRIPANLVVLSACQTGLGKEVKGEGLIGLTRGFMYAGASGVTASLWKVEDEASAELMKRFYQGMFERGLTPAAALRDAQIQMWNQKRWHAPFYWAGFVIQGQYNQKEAIPSGFNFPNWRLAAVGLGCVVAALLLWKRRRRNSSGTMVRR